MEAPSELLQVPCGITTADGVLAQELKNAEHPLEFLSRHHIAQPLQFLPCRTVASVPDGFRKLLYVIHSAFQGARADSIQPLTSEGNRHDPPSLQ
ncbi:MAG: hypothetical protein VX796_07670 [Pseudomonadota bacterium]|jgi:hypothetical protein|nr:hypothetical protein [Pseudomonadota bacterium]